VANFKVGLLSQHEAGVHEENYERSMIEYLVGICIWEVPGSNLVWVTNYPDSGFS
jgi:hypothetical protein